MKGLIYRLAVDSRDIHGADEVKRQVFVEEQGIPEAEVFAGSGDAGALDMVVLDGDRVVGTARLVFPEPDTAKIERMAVLKDYRQHGVGRQIVAFLLGELDRRQIKNVYLHAQQPVAGFYRACGFQVAGEPFDEVGIRHVRMEKT